MGNRLIILVESRIRRNVYVRFGGEYLETCHSNMVRHWVLSLQRDGRAVRKGNEIAKLYADNKVDVIIYAVEKSLDSYKFNLLHNKQLFIEQLKNNRLGSRTIDEGSMDEKSGMNFSEYVAILSGNTDLLEKAKLEKKIAALDSERQAFLRSKWSSETKLKDIRYITESNNQIIDRLKADWGIFNSRVQLNNEGNRLNPIMLNGVEGSDPKNIGARLSEYAEKARTQNSDFNIGSLYGFNIVVKTESSASGLFEMTQNRFFIIGDSGIHYSHNNGKIAEDPVLASMNFLNALEKIPKLVEKYISDNEKAAKDIPVLESVLNATWKKEDELKELNTQLSALDRKIQLSLKPIEQSGQQQEQEEEVLGQPHQIVPSASASVVSRERSQTGRQSENFGQNVAYAAQPLKNDEQSSFAKIMIKTYENSQRQRKGIKL